MENATIKSLYTLPNGAQVVREYKASNGTHLVLAYNGGVLPWVTWRVDKDLNAFWGRYFRDETAAVENFELRIQQIQNLI